MNLLPNIVKNTLVIIAYVELCIIDKVLVFCVLGFSKLKTGIRIRIRSNILQVLRTL